jgi:hypothetical protein
LHLHLTTARGEAQFVLGDSAKVYPSDEWLTSLATQVPYSQSYVVYE